MAQCWAKVGPFGLNFGPMLTMLGIWWAMWGSMDVLFFWRKNLQQNLLVLRGFFWPFWGSVEPMLGQGWANVGPFGFTLGPRWVIWWAMWGSMGPWREKITPNTKLFVLSVILGDFLGLCWANVGPFWVYVGPRLGQGWAIWALCWAHVG